MELPIGGRWYGSEADHTRESLTFTLSAAYDECLRVHKPVVTRRDIYHEGWIDLNKNGREDIYEDFTGPEEHRLDDLIQMTLDEKTVQLATL